MPVWNTVAVSCLWSAEQRISIDYEGFRRDYAPQIECVDCAPLQRYLHYDIQLIFDGFHTLCQKQREMKMQCRNNDEPAARCLPFSGKRIFS